MRVFFLKKRSRCFCNSVSVVFNSLEKEAREFSKFALNLGVAVAAEEQGGSVAKWPRLLLRDVLLFSHLFTYKAVLNCPRYSTCSLR